ncbi:MAG: hypothetical protein C0417_12625 [Chlorobiaceae bacterium]|nr:hypothetical protein [Chlorobiaceae bacterium]
MKLEKIMDGIKLETVTILCLFIINQTAFAQNTVNVHVQSVPSMKNAYSGITLTAIPGPMTAHTETDSTTGNATLDIPTGTYELMIKTAGHRRFIDTITVNSNQDLDLQVPEWIPTISTYFTDVMDLANCLKDQYGSQGVPLLRRWHDDLQPIRIFHENPPDTNFIEYNAAKNSILERTDSTLKFREVKADSEIGVRVHYMSSDSIPFHAAGYTTVDTWFPDRTPKHMTMLMATDYGISRGTFLRELCRVARIFANSPDIIHVMYLEGNINPELSKDEGNALNIIYKLNLNTDTRKFKPIRDSTITGVKEFKQNPRDFTLEQNYPNPFNPSTNFKFTSSNCQLTILKIYDLLGREIATLVNEVMQPGEHSAKWDASNNPSGVYYYRLTTKDFTSVRKMVLLR